MTRGGVPFLWLCGPSGAGKSAVGYEIFQQVYRCGIKASFMDSLITHLRKLEDAGYVTTVKSGKGVTSRTSVSLSQQGRKAFDNYTAALRQLLDSASTNEASPH